MITKIEPENWYRKAQYKFFKDFDDPFFNLTEEVECSSIYNYAKKNDLSFFLCYVYASLKAANEIEEFRLRILNDDLVLFDEVHACPVIIMPDNSFRFACFNYSNNFEFFYSSSKAEIEKVKSSPELITTENNAGVIHYSVTPWIRFTSLKHPRKFGATESIPKITMGKMANDGTKKMMTVNVEANHALMDGYHVSLFLKRFSELCANPQEM